MLVKNLTPKTCFVDRMENAMRNVVSMVCIVLCLGSLAHAEIYKWVDRNGTTHFSDTLAGVPPEYRPHVEEKTGLAIPPLSSDSTAALESRPGVRDQREQQPLEPA